MSLLSGEYVSGGSWEVRKPKGVLSQLVKVGHFRISWQPATHNEPVFPEEAMCLLDPLHSYRFFKNQHENVLPCGWRMRLWRISCPVK